MFFFSQKFFRCFLVFLVVYSIGCKKVADNIKQDLLIKLITESSWQIVRYLEGTTNLTIQYADYDFKFNKNGTVNAIRNGIVEGTGTWVGNEQSQSITSDFSNSGEPLSRLTGQWIVTNTKSQPWRVFSHRFADNKELVLDLQEK